MDAADFLPDSPISLLFQSLSAESGVKIERRLPEVRIRVPPGVSLQCPRIADHVGNRVLASGEIALIEQAGVHDAVDAVRLIVEAAKGSVWKAILHCGLSMKLESLNKRATSNLLSRQVSGRCLCGAVELEIDFPAFWAWHDHSAASRRAHGAAYATYIGCWRKHARVAKGRRSIARFEDAKTESTRSFCSRCGTPRAVRAQALAAHGQYPAGTLHGRIGREPRYHVAIEQLQDWAYIGNRLVPVKGYPGVVWECPKSRRRPREIDDPEFPDRRVPSARAYIVW